MLENKVIIYDDSCPMCKLYTYWFVAWGFLKAENRIGFATAPPEVTTHVDLDRGRHEIPLFDRSTGETIYGLKALTHILGSRWTWLKPVLNSKPFWWTFYPLYQIITFNRRVIAGCRHCCGFDCAPDLNRFYRSVYLVLASCLIGMIASLLFVAKGNVSTFALTSLVALGLIGFVCGLVTRVSSGSLAGWNYAGNYTTVLLIASLLLLPLTHSVAWPEPLSWFVFATAFLVALKELRRREL